MRGYRGDGGSRPKCFGLQCTCEISPARLIPKVRNLKFFAFVLIFLQTERGLRASPRTLQTNFALPCLQKRVENTPPIVLQNKVCNLVNFANRG